MAQCVYCKAETQLHKKSGVPVCVNCEEIRARLVRDVADATLRADAASETFQKVMTEVPSGIPHSDGIQRIKNVSRQLTKVRDEMLKAHNRLNDFISSGLVPDDLN
jgi:hypothetical protein